MSVRLQNAVTFLFISLTSTTFVGCMGTDQSQLSPFASKPEVVAAQQIADSFRVSNRISKVGRVRTQNQTSESDLSVDQAIISISKSALEKEFLFQSFSTPQPGVAMGNGNRSRIVAFRKRDQKLFLMEAVQGHSVTRDLPQNLVLAEFPIIKETDTQISFDFNTGMSQLFIAGDWYAHDHDGREFDAAGHFLTIKSRYSYIENAFLDTSNRLVIRQIAQATRPIMGLVELNIPFEVKYYISPYQPDPTFKPVRMKEMDRMGFFETAPELTFEGADLIHATHFNVEKPIVYAISANTPNDYRNAVKEGILYWNKAFGKEVVQVVNAPEGVTAPDPNYNVVQWVNWDQAGFAYADAQMDPRTGETLHAQIYLTSAFAFGGKLHARKLLHQFLNHKSNQDSGDGNKRASLLPVSLLGFEQKRLCNLDLTEQLTSSLANLLSEDEFLDDSWDSAQEAKLLKIAQDYVRDVAAHEAGHTLGLRHNFAGSVAANYALSDRKNLLQSYFEKQATPADTVITSSVMDYLPFEESIMSGDLLLRQKTALEYDRKAIETLYLEKSYADSELPLFCTDTHVGKFSDCQVFIAGSSFVEYAVWSTQNFLKRYPSVVLETYIGQKAPPKGEEGKAVEKVLFPGAEGLSKSLMRSRYELYKNFTTSGALLKVRRTFPVVTGYNLEQVRKAELDYVAGEVRRMGGVDSVFEPISDSFAEQSAAEFSTLLEKRRTGLGYAEQPYEFSVKEMEIMKSSFGKYVKTLQEELIKRDLEILNGKGLGTDPKKLEDHELADLLPSLFKSRIQKYVYSRTGDTILAEMDLAAVKKKAAKHLTLNLPTFTYSFEIRKAAAGLFFGDRSEAIEWGFREHQEVKDEFKKFMDEILTSVPLADLKPEQLSKSAARWVLENRKISGVL